MINIKKFSWIAALGLVMATSSCTDLDEKVYDRIDASTFYKNEASVKGAIATIYNQAGNCFAERFYFLQELPADQISWRVWNMMRARSMYSLLRHGPQSRKSSRMPGPTAGLW